MEMLARQVKEKLELLFKKEEESKGLCELYINSVKELQAISKEIADSCGGLFVVDGICYARSTRDLCELSALPRVTNTYQQSDAVKVVS